MSPKTFNFLIFVYICSIIIGLVVEGSQFGMREGTVLGDLAGFSTLKVGGLVGFATGTTLFFRGLFRILAWDYAFYVGSWEILRWVYLCVFNGGVVWGLTSTFAPVIANFTRIFR